MRIATWNVNSLKARLERVEEWVAYAEPDVLCLQETKLADAAFPAMAFAALGYEAVHHGQGARHGVAILSRVGIGTPRPASGDGARGDRREPPDLRARAAASGSASVYVPNGRTLDNPAVRRPSWRGWPSWRSGSGCRATPRAMSRSAATSTSP